MHTLLCGQPPLETEHRLAAFLLRLGSSMHYRSIGALLGISDSSVSRSIDDCLLALLDPKRELRRTAFVWPTSVPGGPEAAAEGFRGACGWGNRGFESCMGAVDGSHIRTQMPVPDKLSWINRKGYQSVILQGTCDSTMKFIDIVVGWPGSVHDARVFRNSPMFLHAHETFPPGFYILGDSGYPLQEWCLVPFKSTGYNSLTHEQRRFNKRLSQTRVVVERAFGLLKQRWRSMHRLHVQTSTRAIAMIEAACVLHNYGLRNDTKVWVPFEDELANELRDNKTAQELIEVNDAAGT